MDCEYYENFERRDKIHKSKNDVDKGGRWSGDDLCAGQAGLGGSSATLSSHPYHTHHITYHTYPPCHTHHYIPYIAYLPSLPYSCAGTITKHDILQLDYSLLQKTKLCHNTFTSACVVCLFMAAFLLNISYCTYYIKRNLPFFPQVKICRV